MGKSMLDRMKDKIAGAGGQGGDARFLLFKENERNTVRFLCEGDDAVELLMYEPKEFGKGSRFASPENWGEKVDFDLTPYRKATYYFFPVWSYDQEKMMILFAKASNKSILVNIAANWEDNGTLMDRDYTIKRSGSGLSTVYTFNSKSPSAPPKQVKDAAKAYNQESVKEAAKAFFAAPANLLGESDKTNTKAAWEDDDDTPKQTTKQSNRFLNSSKDLEMYDED